MVTILYAISFEAYKILFEAYKMKCIGYYISDISKIKTKTITIEKTCKKFGCSKEDFLSWIDDED